MPNVFGNNYNNYNCTTQNPEMKMAKNWWWGLYVCIGKLVCVCLTDGIFLQ